MSLNNANASGLVRSLVDAEPEQVNQTVLDLRGYRSSAVPKLRKVLKGTWKTEDSERARLHARIALVEEDPSLIPDLIDDLTHSKNTYATYIGAALNRSKEPVQAQLISILRDSNQRLDERYRAGAVLADFKTMSGEWTELDHAVIADGLVSDDETYLTVA